MRFVDHELGQFFLFLKEEGLYDDALIIIWSDHGEGLFDHEDWSHSEVYDHTLRVPHLMRLVMRCAHPPRPRTDLAMTSRARRSAAAFCVAFIWPRAAVAIRLDLSEPSPFPRAVAAAIAHVRRHFRHSRVRADLLCRRTWPT